MAGVVGDSLLRRCSVTPGTVRSRGCWGRGSARAEAGAGARSEEAWERRRWGGRPTTRMFSFRLTLSGPLTAEEVRDEFIRQYYSASSDAEVASRRWIWQVPARGTNADEVKRGYMDMSVTMHFQTDVESLDAQQLKEINDETDKRYWAATGLPEGTKIDPHDEQAKKLWLGLRNAVLTEDKQLEEIQSLPDDIKQVLFAGGQNAPELAREDFTRVIALARKLAALTAEERQDYLARITGSTSSFDELESSIDRYVQFRQERAQQAEAFAPPRSRCSGARTCTRCTGTGARGRRSTRAPSAAPAAPPAWRPGNGRHVGRVRASPAGLHGRAR